MLLLIQLKIHVQCAYTITGHNKCKCKLDTGYNILKIENQPMYDLIVIIIII